MNVIVKAKGLQNQAPNENMGIGKGKRKLDKVRNKEVIKLLG